ncbi:MAG: diacylglycerol kinase family protein [Candidatus Aadella gelida]|nr:diacylglycerol kinase family protein [Candidatus Aadella gelida]
MRHIRPPKNQRKKVSKSLIILNKLYKKKYHRNISTIDLNADIAVTEYSGHAEELARASSEYDIIISAGGDGTIAGIINGMNLENQTLGIIPLGTSNSLARSLGIFSFPQAFQLLLKKEAANIDLIECRFSTNRGAFKRLMATSSGIGFIARSAAIANRHFKPVGKHCYVLAGLFATFFQRPFHADIGINGKTPTHMPFTSLMVSNIPYAATVPMFPHADTNDSFLDVVIDKANFLTQTMFNISSVSKTYFYQTKYQDVIPDKVSDITVKLKESASLMLDGEICGSVERVEYRVLPKKLKLFI